MTTTKCVMSRASQGIGAFGKGMLTKLRPFCTDALRSRSERQAQCRLWGQSRHFDRASLTSGLPRLADIFGTVGMSERCDNQKCATAIGSSQLVQAPPTEAAKR